jgi:hypothetical protein
MGSVSLIPIPIPIRWLTTPKPIIGLAYFCTFTLARLCARAPSANHLSRRGHRAH